MDQTVHHPKNHSIPPINQHSIILQNGWGREEVKSVNFHFPSKACDLTHFVEYGAPVNVQNPAMPFCREVTSLSLLHLL